MSSLIEFNTYSVDYKTRFDHGREELNTVNIANIQYLTNKGRSCERTHKNEEENIADIVRELVLTKYAGSIKNRSNTRRRKVGVVSRVFDSVEKRNAFFSRITSNSYEDISNSALSNSGCSVDTYGSSPYYYTPAESPPNLLNEPDHDELRYSERKFLREALGSQLFMNGSNSEASANSLKQRHSDFSIATEDISALISYASYLTPPRSRRSQHIANRSKTGLIEPIYSRVQKSSDQCSTYGERLTSYPIYEEVHVNAVQDSKSACDAARDQLLAMISREDEVVRQVSKLIDWGKKCKKFWGSFDHLEAERIILLSNERRRAFEVAINTPCCQENLDEILGSVTMKNISCSVDVSGKQKYPRRRFYVGIIQSELQVFCSSFATPNFFGFIQFKDEFNFAKLRSDFEIKFSLYKVAMSWTQRDVCCGFSRKGSRSPSFELIGTTIFNNRNIKYCSFPITDMFDVRSHNLLCTDITISAVHPRPLRSLINIGTEWRGVPVWRQKWCVLDGYNINMYQHPSDETFLNALCIINLKKCVSCELDNIGRRFLKCKTLKITIMDNNSVSTYYLALENSNEFNAWSTRIKSAINAVRVWEE